MGETVWAKLSFGKSLAFERRVEKRLRKVCFHPDRDRGCATGVNLKVSMATTEGYLLRNRIYIMFLVLNGLT